MNLAPAAVARIIVPAILLASGTIFPVLSATAQPAPAASVSTAAVSTGAAAKPVYFRTLPPGAKLPSGAQCRKLVNKTPEREIKAMNRPYNRRTGQKVGKNFFTGDSPKANARIAPRINGAYTGTTIDILRWAACKWGIDQDMVFAQAAVESWWRQTTKGDWGTDAAACPAGHKLGQDGRPGQCPQSWGVLQNRFPYENGGWPALLRSTAMNADTAYGIWRACFDGYETWLNTVQRGQRYHAGDAWGCVGTWFAGRWRTAPALGYITKVKQYLKEKIWQQPDFKELG